MEGGEEEKTMTWSITRTSCFVAAGKGFVLGNVDGIKKPEGEGESKAGRDVNGREEEKRTIGKEDQQERQGRDGEGKGKGKGNELH